MNLFMFLNGTVITSFRAWGGGARSIEGYTQNTHPKLLHSCSAIIGQQ